MFKITKEKENVADANRRKIKINLVTTSGGVLSDM